MKKHTSIISIVFLISVLIFNLPVVKAGDDKFNKMDSLLSVFKWYEYGMTLEPYNAIKDIDKSCQTGIEKSKIESKYLTFVKSEATVASKQMILKRLSLVGGPASVPALAALLTDVNLANAARYALERIPGTQTDDALLMALGKAHGNMLIGIINSLGNRKVEKTVPEIKKYLSDNDKNTSLAAIAALGQIANDKAAKELENVLAKTDGDVLNAVLDAYLNCATVCLKNGDIKKADKIYDKIEQQDRPIPIRIAVLNAKFLAHPEQAEQLLYNVIKNENADLKTAAIALLPECAKLNNIQKFADLLAALTPLQKVQLLTSFEIIGDKSVLNTVLEAVNDPDQEVRIAACKTLAVIGDKSTVNILVERAASTTDNEQEAARQSLYLLNADGVDETIVSSLDTEDDKIKVELLKSIGERNIVSAADMLFKLATDPKQRVRTSSIKVLADISQPQQLPQLLDLLLNCQTGKDREEAVSTVTQVCRKIENPENKVDLVLQKLETVSNLNNRIDLIRVLGKVGVEKSLPVLQKALLDPDQEIQISAIRALSDWPTTKPIDDLYQIAKNHTENRHQVLALRGFIRMIKMDEDRDDIQTVTLYKQALNLSKNSAEKKSVLSGLADLRCLEALDTANQFINDPELQAEAEISIYDIARHIRRDYPDEAKTVLLNLANITQNVSLKSKIDNIIKEMEE